MEFCICAEDDGRFKLCVLTPRGKLLMMMDRESFEQLREKVNACHDGLRRTKIPGYFLEAFEEDKDG